MLEKDVRELAERDENGLVTSVDDLILNATLESQYYNDQFGDRAGNGNGDNRGAVEGKERETKDTKEDLGLT